MINSSVVIEDVSILDASKNGGKRMKNSCKKENGITLMSLVITIVILIILASIATYSGIEVIKSSKLTKFTTEMKIMQTQVNELYQKMQG